MKKTLLIIGVILVFMAIITGYKYRLYKEKQEQLKSGIFYDLYRPLDDYYKEHKNYPNEKKEFTRYLKRGNYDDLLFALDRIDFNYLNSNDTIIIYAFGYDKDDDHLSIRIHLDSINFFNSFYVDGDIPLYIVAYNWFENKNKSKHIIDTLPKPPLPPDPLKLK
jgi:hypothetical protein